MRFFARLLLSILPLVLVPPILGVTLMTVRANGVIEALVRRNAELELEFFESTTRDEFEVLRRLGLENSDFYRDNAQRNVVEYAESRAIPGATLFILDESGNTVAGTAPAGSNNVVLEANPEPWGWTLGISVSPEYVSGQIRRASGYLIALLALIFAPLMAVLSVLTRRMSRPVEELERTAAGLAAGDLSLRARVVHEDEVGSLARTFNRMAESLQEFTSDLERQVRDRTAELQESVQELKDTQEQLARRDRLAALGSLVAGIAHEINTPIGLGVTSSTLLSSRVEALAAAMDRREANPDEIRSIMDQISSSADIVYRNLKRAEELVTSFTQLAVDQSDLPRRRELVLPDYLYDVIDSLEARLQVADIKVVVECPQRITLVSYPATYHQVFTNLILNSIIHGFAETGPGIITINIEMQDDKLRIRYADNGAGMEPETAARVFEPFFTTRMGQGRSGLGMNIVYNIVTQRLEGTIDLASQPGHGVQVEIVVPCPPAPSSPEVSA